MKKDKVSPKVLKLIEGKKGVKIDLGCGPNKQDKDWFGIDYRALPGVDLVHNLENYPYPLPSDIGSMAVASHVVEHINPHGGVFIEFMNEVWRLLKPGADFLISTPYAGSPGYWWDPTHCNPCSEMTLEYFDPEGPLTQGGFYKIYAPLPWKIKVNTWHDVGNLEAVLTKRPLDDKWNTDKHYLETLKKHNKKFNK